MLSYFFKCRGNTQTKKTHIKNSFIKLFILWQQKIEYIKEHEAKDLLNMISKIPVVGKLLT